MKKKYIISFFKKGGETKTRVFHTKDIIFFLKSMRGYGYTITSCVELKGENLGNHQSAQDPATAAALCLLEDQELFGCSERSVVSSGF